MTENNDEYPADGQPGVAFMLGVLSGAAIGVALVLLCAPGDGATLRRHIGRRARDLRDDAGAQLNRVADVADDLVERGRDIADRVRTAASTGIREARHCSAGVAADLADVVRPTDT